MVEKRVNLKEFMENWFYNESEIDTKLLAKANVDLGTANYNVVTDSAGKITVEPKPTIPDVSGKADKTDGASEITDANAGGYTSISASLSSSSTVADILSAINTKFSTLSLDVIIVTTDKGTATADKMNKLYVEVGSTKTTVYFVKATESGGTTTYSWEPLDDIILDDLSIDWPDITNNPFASASPSDYATSGHSHGSINNGGTITSSASSIKNVVVTDSSDNIKVASVDKLTCGTFTELQSIITSATAGDVIVLNKDYKNAGSESEITINKNLTIIGNGHTLDGDEKSRILKLDGGTSTTYIEVNITGVYFVNGKSSATSGDTGGGAIKAYQYHRIHIIDCSFNNNYSYSNGGAIYGHSYSTLINCNFFNNTSHNGNGGAVSCNSNYIISYCNFNNNSASSDGKGGAISNVSSSTTISDCVFEGNSTKNGGAIHTVTTGKILDCIFKNNTATGNGNDICADTNTTVYNCDTTSNDLYKVTNRLYLTDEIDLVTSGTYAGYIVFHTR